MLRDENWDIWVYDLARGVSTRLTFDDGIDTEQVWSPDGEYLIFSSDSEGPDSLYRKRADGSGETERLTEAEVRAVGELVVARRAVRLVRRGADASTTSAISISRRTR